jgi:hypothetical protein
MNRVRSECYASNDSVSTDEDILRTASDWQQKIEEFIEQCDEVIVLLSSSAKGSSHVRREIEYAKIQEKTISAILVEGTVKTSLPLALSGCQYTDRRDEFAVD